MKKIASLLKYLRYYLSSLVRLYPTSKEYTRFVNWLIDNATISAIDEYVAIFTCEKYPIVPLWINNYPYAYGTIYSAHRNQGGLYEFFKHWQEEEGQLVQRVCEESSLVKSVVQDLHLMNSIRSLPLKTMPDRRTVYRLRQVIEKAKLPQ